MLVTLTGNSEGEFPAERYADKVEKEKAFADMSNRYIPSNSVYRIESIRMENGKERRSLAEKGKASKQITADLHAGKYVYSLRRRSETHDDDKKFCNYFYVGLDEATWKRFAHIRPRNFRRMQTSKGIEFRCNWTGCSEIYTHTTAAVLHEMEDHQGLDPLNKKGREAPKAAIPVVPPAATVPRDEPALVKAAPKKSAKKKRGRPPKKSVDMEAAPAGG